MNKREIKFRAWDKKDKRFWIPEKDGDWFYRDKNEIKTVKDVILIQFTGLLDKNGKEIYEGDVIEHTITGPNHDGTGETSSRQKDLIEWDSKGACFTIPHLYKYQNLPIEFHPDTYEIIGNLYENPGLLK